VRRKAGARATRWGPGVVARAGESVRQLWAASELPGLVPLVAMRRQRHPWACVGGDVRRAAKSVQMRAPGGVWPCEAVAEDVTVPTGGSTRRRAARGGGCTHGDGWHPRGSSLVLKKTWARGGGHDAQKDMGASGGAWS